MRIRKARGRLDRAPEGLLRRLQAAPAVLGGSGEHPRPRSGAAVEAGAQEPDGGIELALRDQRARGAGTRFEALLWGDYWRL
jgi:hypothetical protein